MKRILLKSLIVLIACFMLAELQATTISPFPNIGEMGKASQHSVTATAIQNITLEYNGVVYYQTRFVVTNRIKGTIEDVFFVQNLRRNYGGLERRISGDIIFEEGKEYLLFLEEIQSGVYRTTMLSHGVFVKEKRNKETLFVPVDQGLLHSSFIRPDGIEVESFAVFKSAELISHLSEVLNTGVEWKKQIVSSVYSVESFHQDPYKNAPPNQCYVNSSPPLSRWSIFPGQSLPVRYAASGDPSCSLENVNIENAISRINTNYPGVFLSGPSSYSGFTPNCNTGTQGDAVFDNEFINFMNSIGGPRNIAIIFDDPCDEIPDLNNCSGTLAYGGVYSFSNTHVFNGMPWREAGYGFVVVNNDVGNCNCSSGYDLMLTHEMTHALGFDHIPTSAGSANMNPTCCISISPLDVECLIYTYPSTTVAAEITNFSANVENQGLRLSWETLSETGVDHFILERSEDGIRYEEMARVSSNDVFEGTNSYEYFDFSPFNGHNYYRLASEDQNGNIGEYRFAEASFSFDKGMLFYPNPTNGSIAELRVFSELDARIDIHILDLTGKLIKNMRKEIGSGINWVSVDLSDLPNGVHFLRVYNGLRYEMIRIIKSS